MSMISHNELKCMQLISLTSVNMRHVIYESLQPFLVERNSCQNNTKAKRLTYISLSTNCSNTSAPEQSAD